MINQFYLEPINQMTDEERSVFFYRYYLKLPNQSIALNLNKSLKRVIAINRAIKIDLKFAELRKNLLEEFEIADML